MIAGYGANMIITSVSTHIGMSIARATIGADMSDDDKLRREFQGLCIGGIVGGGGSLWGGNRIRTEPGWAATGIAQMVFAGAVTVVCTIGLFFDPDSMVDHFAFISPVVMGKQLSSLQSRVTEPGRPRQLA